MKSVDKILLAVLVAFAVAEKKSPEVCEGDGTDHAAASAQSFIQSKTFARIKAQDKKVMSGISESDDTAGADCEQLTVDLPGFDCHAMGSTTVELRQGDFDAGTYIITQPGTYKLMEDITFEPKTPGCLPPLNSAIYKKLDGYWLGFFAAIAISADNVMLDLNGHTIAMSTLFSRIQRFFTIVELANKPFTAEVGPPQFGRSSNVLVPAHSTIIKNGVLGLSSHMGIHGNENSNILINDLEIRDFETGGIQFNAATHVHIKKTRVGPSLGGALSNGKVPGMATLSQATLLLGIIRGFEHENHTEFQTLRAVVDEFVANPSTTNPAAAFLTDNGFSGLPDGSALYGILFHKSGPAIGNFAVCANSVNEQLDGDPLETVTLDDVIIQELHLKADEVVKMLQMGPCKPAVGPAGDVVQVWRLQDTAGNYQGTALSDAQLKLAELKKQAQDSGESAEIIFEKYGGTTLTENLQNWMRGIGSFSQAESGATYACNGDAMSHVNKGVVGLRVEFMKDVSLKNVTIRKLSNVGVRSAHFNKCDGPNAPYLGNDVRGVSIGGGTELDLSGGVPVGVTVEELSGTGNNAVFVDEGTNAPPAGC